MKQNYKYPREEKLKQKNDISLLFEKGKWQTCGNLRLISFSSEEIALHKMGVSVSKRYFKKAVDRNRIKRQMRDIVRLQKDSLVSTQSFAYFISYTHTQLPDFELLQQSISTLFQKLNSIKQ